MSRHRVRRLAPLLFGLAAGAAAPSVAQVAEDSLAGLAGRFASMTAVTGYEQAMVDTVLGLLPGAARDRAGNAVRGAGSARRRLAVCALDEPGWVVGGVRSDGWLTLRRSPGGAAPLRDRQLEGSRVTVHGGRGAVPGVVAVRSIHLTRGRDQRPTGRFTVDSALVDVGAAGSDEVARLGLRVLSVVTLAKRPHWYGSGLLAAPYAGRRAACAALLHAARASLPDAAVIAFTVRQELGARGLAALLHQVGPFEEALLVEAGAAAGPGVAPAVGAAAGARFPGLGRVTRLSLPVRYAESPVETVALADARALAADITAWLGAGR